MLTPLGALQQTDADRQDSLAAKPAQLTKTVHARLNMENWAERRLVTAIIRAKKAWQAVAILSILCLIATSTAAGWLFLDRQRHTYFLNRVQREHNLLVEQISSENEKLIAENAALKTRDHLLPSSITPAEASAKK